MKRTIKKSISAFLVIVMLAALAVPAMAKDTSAWISQSKSDIPLIRISGDGEKLVDENGDKVFHYKDFASILDSDDEEDEVGPDHRRKTADRRKEDRHAARKDDRRRRIDSEHRV